MINETGSARAAIREAACVVDAELSCLYNQKRDDDDTIKLLKDQIKIMLESVEYANEEKHQSYRVADQSIMMMYWSLIVTFIAIGYVAWGW